MAQHEEYSDPIRVMVVDDSTVIRSVIAKSIEAIDDVVLVGRARNGQVAIEIAQHKKPDVIILDIEMPVMDGLTALPLLLQDNKHVKILVCSTLSSKGASVSLKALSLGAADCIVKPTSTSEVSGSDQFHEELKRNVEVLGVIARRARLTEHGRSKDGITKAPEKARATSPIQKDKDSFSLHKESQNITGQSIVAIGSSTGGPQALFTVLKSLTNIKVPIVITQHMPKTFTRILAQHIENHTTIKSYEGEEDMPIEAGNAYVAPGGRHMLLTKGTDGNVIIKLNDGPPENFCKPSVDPMMRSVISLYGKEALGVILTGMGNDGVVSCSSLVKEHGGRVVAQDKNTSTVWGMPGAVAKAGICSDVLPLLEIGPKIKSIL